MVQKRAPRRCEREQNWTTVVPQADLNEAVRLARDPDTVVKHIVYSETGVEGIRSRIPFALC